MTFFIHHNNKNLIIKFDAIINLIEIIVQNKSDVLLKTKLKVNSDFCIIPFDPPKGHYKIQIIVEKRLFNRRVFVG